ncbi:MAG: efflux RND transporter periplasmic adaptor subunit [Bacteroidales bacterium]|nr:efflux RND transporter periplasmic adaptor subunit [Bacteroidales bacterium]
MRKKNFIYFIGSILVIGLAVALSGFFMKNQPEPKQNLKDENLLYVKVDTVSTKKLHPSMKYEGRISSYETVSLAAEVSGRIMEGEVPFKEGEDFEKGDLLVRIYKEDAQAAMTSGKSNFLRTLSSILPDLKVDFPDEYQKWKNFFNAVDVKKALPALPEINSEQEQVFLASRGVLSEYYSLQQQEINLSKYNIYAPFEGAFQKVNQQVGAIASPGAALASIVRTDRLEAVVPVPPEDARWIQTGIEVKLTGNNGIVKQGRVTRVADFLDPSTQSVSVYIKYLPGGSKSFKVGEFVQATFEISREVSGFTIPREALLDAGAVYTVRDNQLRKEPVEVIRKLEDHVVLSGLENGTLVVSESLVDVSEGQEVKTR